MALISLRRLLDHAAENDYGVAAFNINNLEQFQAVMEAADETDSPVIVQASRGARKYAWNECIQALAQALQTPLENCSYRTPLGACRYQPCKPPALHHCP